jgi:hypothetical protein
MRHERRLPGQLNSDHFAVGALLPNRAVYLRPPFCLRHQESVWCVAIDFGDWKVLQLHKKPRFLKLSEVCEGL